MTVEGWTRDDLVEAVQRAQDRNERAQRAENAYLTTSPWRVWRRQMAWREWCASIKAFRTFEEDLREIVAERKRKEESA